MEFQTNAGFAVGWIVLGVPAVASLVSCGVLDPSPKAQVIGNNRLVLRAPQEL